MTVANQFHTATLTVAPSSYERPRDTEQSNDSSSSERVYTNHTFRLLELPKELDLMFLEAETMHCQKKRKLNELQHSETTVGSGHEESLSLTIRGTPTSEAVLCTPAKTYSLREVHTSNSLLISALIPSDDPSWKSSDTAEYMIVDTSQTVLECSERVPRLDGLIDMLESTAFSGPDQEKEYQKSHTKFYTFRDLQEEVQASDEEIRAALKERDAILLDGHYRMLSPSYAHELLDQILTFAVTEEFPLDAFPVKKFLEAARRERASFEENAVEGDVQDQVLEHVLRGLAKRSEKTIDGGESDDVEFDREKIILSMAEWLLAADPNKTWNLTDFTSTWQNAVPDTFTVDTGLLKTIAIIEPSLPPAQQSKTTTTDSLLSIRYFPRSALSPTPQRRFQELFLARPKWPAEEIRPYLENLEVDKKKADKLLLKYTRGIRDGSGMVYTSRMK